MKTITKIIFTILVLLIIFLIAEVVRSPDKDSAEIYFFNVGQGDAELIQNGNYQILIDGGPNGSILSDLSRVMPLSDRDIEIVILTHPHSDHLVGLNQIFERYKVGKVYFTGVVYTSNGYSEFLEKIKSLNIATEIPSVGHKITPFESGELTFLWPGDRYKDRTNDNLNNTTEVVRFCYFSKCAVFLGDLELDSQKEMFAQLDNQKIEYTASILKISHHGSTNGTDQTTLNKIKPEYAIIEVGADNQFGHPHVATIDLLNLLNIRTSRTDRDGTVEFRLKDGLIETK